MTAMSSHFSTEGMPHMGHPGHGDMDVGGGGGGGGGMQCQMSMVWNTATEGMCIVFPSWHIRGPSSMFYSLIVLFVLGAMLEYLRYRIRSMDVQLIGAYRLGGTGGRDGPHRRKASVQQVLGYGHPVKSSGVGGTTLGSSLSNAGSGRASPLHFTPDSASSRSSDDDGGALLPGGGGRSRRPQSLSGRVYNAFIPPLLISRRHQLHRAALYVSSLSLSMFLMLVFMTYNAWLIAAVLVGAATGHYLFHRDLAASLLSDDKAVTACH